MSDKENKNNPAESSDEKLHISKSIFETSREIQKKEAEEARHKQEELEKILAERRRKAAEARDKRLEAERLELIRLKQGIIEESETIHEEKEEELKLPFFKRISSFFYLNKWWLGLGTVFTVIAVFLIVNLLSRPNPDIIVLMIGESYTLSEECDLQGYIASFADDFNGNGEILASVYYIPYTGIETKDYANAVHTKLSAELQTAEGVIVIGNKMGAELFETEGVFTDLSELYPDNQLIKKDRLMLGKSKLAERLGVDGSVVSDDWFMAIRAPRKLMNISKEKMQEVYDKDFPVFDKLIKDLSE